ncbi:MAG: acyl-CoA thioesterase [Vitreimonas sp.]
MSSLRAVIDSLAPDGAHWVIDAPEAWSQGRTLYGGMTAALACEAVKRAHGELAPLRSAQLAFIGPASGRLRFGSTLLRRGRSSTIIASDCMNEQGYAGRALFVFAVARESRVVHDFLPMPDVPAPEASPPFRKGGPPSTRGFWDNFETRLAAGARLMDLSAPRPEFSVWTRCLDTGGADPTTALLAIADCLPPAAMTHFPQLGPISTMTWAIDIAHVPQNVDAWQLLRSSSEHAREGYSLQTMAMWTATGELIAAGRQAVAIFV